MATLIGERDPSAQRARSRIGLLLGLFWGSVGLAGLAFVALALMRGAIDADTAWRLAAGADWLATGGRLYETAFVDPYPPGPFWLALPAAAFGSAAVSCWIVLTLGVCVGAVLGVVAVARGAGFRGLGVAPVWLAPTILGLGVAYAGAVFGEREHWTFLLCLPHIAMAAARADRRPFTRRLAIVVGVMAGIGLIMKPQMSLGLIVVELWLIYRRREPGYFWRAEMLSLAGALLLYVAAVAIFAPAYFSTVLPMLAASHGVYSATPFAALSRPEALIAPMAVVGALMLAPQPPGRGLSARDARLLAQALSAASIGFWLAYALQGEGADHHRYPATAVGLAALSVTFGARIADLAIRGTSRAAIARTVAAFVLPLGLMWIGGGHQAASKARHLLSLDGAPDPGGFLAVIEKEAGGGPVYFLSSELRPAFPLMVNLSNAWPSRWGSLWLLPGVVDARREAGAPLGAPAPAPHDVVERFLRAGLIGDLAARPPELVFVETRRDKWALPEGFDHLGYFRHDPAFLAFWEDYEKIGEHSGFDVWRRLGREAE